MMDDEKAKNLLMMRTSMPYSGEMLSRFMRTCPACETFPYEAEALHWESVAGNTEIFTRDGGPAPARAEGNMAVESTSTPSFGSSANLDREVRAMIADFLDSMANCGHPWPGGTTGPEKRYENNARNHFVAMASNFATYTESFVSTFGSIPWGSLVMDGLLRRLVYDPNIRTMGSLRELDAYVSSTPFAPENVSGTSVGVYGKERSSPKEVDEMRQKTVEIWHFITGCMMGGHGEYATGEKGLKMTLDSGVGYSMMFFEHMYQAIGSTCATKTVITWAAGCQTPFETCWKSKDTITVWYVIPRNLLSTAGGKSGAVGAPVASEELAEEIRWFLSRNVKMALGTTANPAPAVVLKVRIIETGEYKTICEEIRTIKETATSPMGGEGVEWERDFISSRWLRHA